MKPRTSQRIALVTLVSVLAAGVPADAEKQGRATRDQTRWLPASCQALLAGAEEAAPGSGGSAEEAWNRHYRLGFEALENRDLDTAERSMCRALAAAQMFGPHDMRAAETFDELGLLFFLRGDDAQAEAMQGAAVVEMLLALGPVVADMDASQKESCRSSTRTYLERLSWIYSRQGRPEKIAELRSAPYLSLGLGYVPASSLEPRIEWLIARYLLTEDLAAADWLEALRRQLQDEIAGAQPKPRRA